MKKKSVPDGWLPVSAIGKPISGTRFLPFKVPLKDAVCNNLAPNERFSPAMLMEREPNLQLIIDLTNTKRYYDAKEFTANGLQYTKIFCPGRQIPPPGMMKQFFDVVDKFMNSDNGKEKYIGVHCTHGINRTGYFICNYMMKKLGFTADSAIDAFQTARGHNIEREYFIEKLKGSTEQNEDETVLPAVQEFHTTEDYNNSNNYSDTRTRPPRKSRFNCRGKRYNPYPAPSYGPPEFGPHPEYPPGPSYDPEPFYPHNNVPPHRGHKRSHDFSQQSLLNYYDGDEGYYNNRYQSRYKWHNSKYRKINNERRGGNSSRGSS